MTKKRRWYLLWPIAFSFVAGAALIAWAKNVENASTEQLFRDVVLELGVALLIGGILASTIEFYMRKQKDAEDAEHLREIESNVFFALFGTALPNNVVRMMYDILFFPRFLRRSLVITIKLRELSETEKQCDPTATNLLVLNQVVTYTAHNVSRGDAIHCVEPQEFILVPHMQFPQPFRSFTATPFGGAPVITDVQKCSSPDPDHVQYHLTTKEVSVPEGDKVNVVSEIELVCRDTDMRTWLTYYPADDLKLRVELSAELEGQLDLAVDQSHHDALTVDKHTTDHHRKFGWEITRPVLPYQGVVVFWRRKDTLQQQKSQSSRSPHASGA
jgi:hypothetical protein